MKRSSASNISIGLIHHPVVDKNGEIIKAAVTSIDLHDIARASKTYGVEAFYVVTPLEDQHVLVQQIISHWVTGTGAKYNPDRQSALALIRLKPTFGDVLEEMTAAAGNKPHVVATSARMENSNMSYPALKRLTEGHRPVLLLFGTAWGLAPEVMKAADYRLAPINGEGDYNHLSVRSAVSIILDRIMGT